MSCFTYTNNSSLLPVCPCCSCQGDDEDGTLPFELAVLEAGLAEVCSHLAGRRAHSRGI
jgi:hypothetical protein